MGGVEPRVERVDTICRACLRACAGNCTFALGQVAVEAQRADELKEEDGDGGDDEQHHKHHHPHVSTEGLWTHERRQRKH